ncbi:MAG: hypothetical protein ACE5JB_04980 [bacterium]
MPIKRNSIPNDTYFPQQYYFDNTSDVDINAPEAWDLSTGDPSIVVAVIDDGGEAHEDLADGCFEAGYDTKIALYIYADPRIKKEYLSFYSITNWDKCP